MGILRRMGAATVTGPAVLVMIGLVAGPSVSATWSVKPGGAFTAKSAKVVFTDKDVSVTCTSSAAIGTFKSGGGLPAQDIGGISPAFSGCTGPVGAVTVTSTDLPWQINALSYDLNTDTATLQIAGLSADVSMTDCSFSVSGNVEGQYPNQTGKFKLQDHGDTLVISDVSGCLGVVSNGDSVKASATYKFKPIQTIGSP
jgi:hypothetical protein